MNTIQQHRDLPEWGHRLTTPTMPHGWVLTAGVDTVRGTEVVWVEVVDDYADARRYASVPTAYQDAVARRLVVIPATEWLEGLEAGSITIA